METTFEAPEILPEGASTEQTTDQARSEQERLDTEARQALEAVYLLESQTAQAAQEAALAAAQEQQGQEQAREAHHNGQDDHEQAARLSALQQALAVAEIARMEETPAASHPAQEQVAESRLQHELLEVNPATITDRDIQIIQQQVAELRAAEGYAIQGGEVVSDIPAYAPETPDMPKAPEKEQAFQLFREKR